MAEFIVSEVIDGDTFRVKNGWNWNGKTGYDVRAYGYDAPERGQYGYKEAKQKLTRLILSKNVEIKNPRVIDNWGRLIADVYYNGSDLASYFSAYKI